MVASITSSQALLLPPTDLITLSNGSPATFFATIKQHFQELAHQHDTIAKKHDKMHTLINTVRVLVDVHAIEQTGPQHRNSLTPEHASTPTTSTECATSSWPFTWMDTCQTQKF
jgi:hypothetical protein